MIDTASTEYREYTDEDANAHAKGMVKFNSKNQTGVLRNFYFADLVFAEGTAKDDKDHGLGR